MATGSLQRHVHHVLVSLDETVADFHGGAERQLGLLGGDHDLGQVGAGFAAPETCWARFTSASAPCRVSVKLATGAVAGRTPANPSMALLRATSAAGNDWLAWVW